MPRTCLKGGLSKPVCRRTIRLTHSGPPASRILWKMTVPLKPLSESPATPTAGRQSFTTAAARRFYSRTWRGFGIPGSLRPAPALRRENGEFGETGEVAGIKRVDTLDAVDAHGGEDLQVENVAAGDGTPAQQADEFFDDVRRCRQHMEKAEQRRNRGERGGRRGGILDAARIGDDGIKLAEYLRGHVKGGMAGAGGFEERARGRMLRRVGVQCVNKNVGVNNAGLNGHRRRCRGGEAGLGRRDAKRAIRGWPGQAEQRAGGLCRAGARRRP